jgi:hypothetical protein
MSCDWDVMCLDCNSHHGFSDANHQSDLMADLAKLGSELAKLGPILNHLSKVTNQVLVQIGYSSYTLDYKWFEKHGNHRLVAVDEYGGCLDECGEWFRCNHCETQQRCKRSPYHDGPHREKRDVP